MGRYSWTAKTEREPTSAAQWVRLTLCILGTGGLFTALLGEWPWEAQLWVAAVVGVVFWVLLEIVWLIRKDERAAFRTPPPPIVRASSPGDR